MQRSAGVFHPGEVEAASHCAVRDPVVKIAAAVEAGIPVWVLLEEHTAESDY